MKNLIIVLAFILLGLFIYSNYIMGTSEDTLQGAISTVMESNISELRQIP